MPDGDIVKIKLGFYRKPYKMICEGKWNNAECANETLRALKKQIQKEGNVAIDTGKVLCSVLEQNFHLVSNQTHELKNIFNEVLRESRVSPNTSGLLNNAMTSLVHDIKYDKVSPFSNLRDEVVKRYIVETHKSSFVGRVNSFTEHHMETPTKEIQKKLNQIEPKINQTIDSWASKLSNGQTVENLRLQRMKRKKITLEENLL